MLLLYIYIASFVLGGILLVASLVLGQGDADHDLDTDVDTDFDGDAALEADGVDASTLEAHGAGEGHGGGLSEVWLPFLSVRFWVYFLCFFGLTGVVLTLLSLAGKWVTLGAALGMGVVTGFAAAYIIQRLKNIEVGVAVTPNDFKGLEATVRLPLEPGARGKVRVEIRGQTVELIAQSDEESPLDVGQRVLIIEMNDSVAQVVRADALDR